METQAISSLVEDLEGHIDDLEESLAPLLKSALSASASKLPLLDKAKLYVLATYAIESVLFSALRLNGVDAKSHPVFQELSRVKQYFGKIKSAETAGAKRSTIVDKEAAGRFIKHGLSGNDRYDRERVERMVREKQGAKRKLEDMQVGTHTRFDGAAKRIRAAEEAEGSTQEEVDGEGEDVIETASSAEPTSQQQRLAAKAERRRQRAQSKLAAQSGDDSMSGSAGAADGSADSARPSPRAPRSHGETFQALLQGSLPDEKKGKKKKRKSKQQELEDKRANEMK